MGEIRVGRGRSAVWVTGALADDLTDRLRQHIGPLVDRVEDAAAKVQRQAERTWPQKTGKSRRGFRRVLTISADGMRFEVTILNRERYTKYIRSTKLGTRRDATRLRSPLQAEIIKPSRAETRALRKVLPQMLAELLEKRVIRG